MSSLVGNTYTSAANDLLKSCAKPGKNKDQVKTETRPAIKNDLNRCILATQQKQYLSFIMRNIDLFSSSLKKIFKKYNNEKIELKNNKSKKNILAMKSILALAISGVIPAETLIAYEKGFFSKNQKSEKQQSKTGEEGTNKETENEKSKTEDQELGNEYENLEKTIKDLEQKLKSNQTDKNIYLISTVVLASLLVGGDIIINKLRELIKLQKGVNSLEDQKKSLEKTIGSVDSGLIKNSNELKEKVDTKKEMLNKINNGVNRLQMEESNLIESISNLKKEMTKLKTEIGDEYNGLIKMKNDLTKQIIDMKKVIEDENENSLKSRLNELQKKEKDLHVQIYYLQQEEFGWRQDIKKRQSELKGLEIKNEELSKEINTKIYESNKTMKENNILMLNGGFM